MYLISLSVGFISDFHLSLDSVVLFPLNFLHMHNSFSSPITEISGQRANSGDPNKSGMATLPKNQKEKVMVKSRT